MALSLATALVLGGAASAAALPPQSDSAQTPVVLTRLTGPVSVDGQVSESEWRNVPPLPVTMYAPVFRGTPTQRTELRVAYDDDALYVSCRCYDTEPSGIRVNSLYRDRWNGDDALAIYVDTFNDKRNAKWFGVTPAGMRFDLLVSDDGNTSNDSWDAVWTSAAVTTPEGWFVETRIPFSTLGFRPQEDGRVVMGLTVTRLVARLGERVTFPEIDPAYPFRRPSLARAVELRDVKSGKPLYVSPYLLGGAGRQFIRAASGARERRIDRPAEAGLDVRFPFTSRLTLDATINTDFAQVEADEQQVALDRFPLFYPERRRFFQEGAALFDFVTAGGARLFHSRRIGLAPDLHPVPILGGARLVGRIGAWDIGALDMQTGEDAGLDSRNFGALRLKRAVLNPLSSAGVFVTSVRGGGSRNAGLGADASLRVTPNHVLDLKWAGTFDARDTHATSLGRRSLIDAAWERRTGRGLYYKAQYSRAGADYRPELGFLPRRDYTAANVIANWYRFTDAHPYFRRVWPGALAFSTYRNAGGALESGQYAFWVQWDTKSGGGGWIEPKWFVEDVAAPFTIGRSITVPAGRYTFADVQVAYTMPSGQRVRTDVDARKGTYFDGTRSQVILSPTWNVNRHLELGGSYQVTSLRFATRGQAETIQLAGLRVRVALDVRASANAFVQYNSTTRQVDANLRLRYNAGEGRDLWLVYNEGVSTDDVRDDLGRPVPRSLSRTLLAKFTYTFSTR